ncbi:hypothetical protein [Candidatus Lariskella endosymbiont of Hedychridium roseum]|uniref:hypothetical protein n=1 Tax=Candidatus Lariskella endosymbiont of Hedychridium roseum TaxID=3077949 RepID=UPI0030CA73C8
MKTLEKVISDEYIAYDFSDRYEQLYMHQHLEDMLPRSKCNALVMLLTPYRI